MSFRTIMIFPDFGNMEIIDAIRDRYDPLAKLVRPHITIVFPFESEMSNEELSSVLDLRLREIAPFDIVLQGFSKHSDSFGHTLFLNLEKGCESIKQIHDSLYANEFKPFDLGYEYVPHITVGKLPTEEELDAAYESIRNIGEAFTTRVRKISVEMIGEHEESIIVLEKDI